MKLTLISVAVVTLAIQCVAHEDFAEVPETQMVYVDEQAVFRCRHMSDDRDIRWRVNGMLVGQDAPPEVNPDFDRDENGNLVDTLTITATPYYNNSEVVCVSEIGSQSTSTLPAYLQVLPRPSSPQSGFTLTPESQNATIGAAVRFTCEHMDSDVVWRINGQSVINLRDVTTASERGVHILTIRNAHREYNNSEIQCKAVFDDGRVSEFTSSAILLLQGPLNSVSNVRMDRDSSTLSWDPPFSLDLTGIHPDIVYCVDIYNITCGRRDLIISDCDVTEPSYTSNAPEGYMYEYIITPRSKVEGARNGTPNRPLKERFSRFSDSISERNSVSTRNIQLAFLNLEPDQPVPSSYTVILESLDGLEDVMLKTTNITTEGDVIVVDVDDRLPLNRVWNCTLLAYGCRENTVLSNVELSTHDIQNVSISSRITGQVRVTGELIQESMATGVLVTIVNATNLEHHLISRDDSGNGIDGVISGLPGGQYTVSVFVVSEDGLPFKRAATKPRRITVENAAGPNRDPPSPTIEYKLDQTSTGTCVTCTFLDSSTTDCVAVIHQQISQLSSSGLMNIESSHKFTRSGDTAYGCIEGVNLEQYQVGVIGGKMIAMEPKSNQRESIAGAITGVIVGFAIAVIVAVTVAIVLCKRRRNNMPICSEVTHRSDSQAVVIESGSRAAAENHYAESAGLPEKPAEEQPLLPPPPLPAIHRVEDDGGSSPSSVSTSHVPGSVDHGTHTSTTADNGADDSAAEEDPPPLPPRLMDDGAETPVPDQVTSDNIGAGDPTYASILARTPTTVKESADSHTHTSDSGAGDPIERPAQEDPPPLPPRLEDSAPVSESADQGASISPPHQVTSDNGAGDPTYAPVLARTQNHVKVFCVSADRSTHTLPTADNGAGDPTERPTEECPPPLPPRLMDDDASNPGVSGSADKGTPHQVSSDNGDPTYTPVLTTTPNAVSQPAATEKVSYEDIQKYQNEQGQHYALPQLKVAKKGPVDDLHQVVYTEIKPHSITQTGDQNIDCTSDRPVTPPPIPSRETATAAVCEPITTDQFYSFLLPHASKWQALGIALSLDKDRLEDEVFPNNETDEACLQEMLELYMMRSDLDHSWEKVQAALGKMESSRDAPTSAQEVSSSEKSPVVSGETIRVPDMDADSDPGKQGAVGKELEESNGHKEREGNGDSGYSSSQLESGVNSVVLEIEDDSSNLSQTSSDSEELHEASEKNRSTCILNPLSENLKDKQVESSDSGYDCSQQSASESSESSVAFEMEDDSTSLSQAALDEPHKSNENCPIPFLSDLGDYESKHDPSFGSQATLTDSVDGGEFDRTMNEKLPIPLPSALINSRSRSRSPGSQLERFCEQPEDEENSDELCKIKPVHCQDSCIHDDYHEALIHQMGLLTDQKARDKLEYNDAVEESPLVHVDSEQASKSLDIVFCTPKTFSALDIPKVHELVTRYFSVSPKYSHLLMLTAVQFENDRLITLYFTCVILSVAYSPKLYTIINVCPVKVRVRVNID